MKHYVFVTESDNDQLRKIYDDFKSIYNVNLDDKKYNSCDSIKKKWEMIIGDTFLKYGGKPKEIYVQKFMHLLYRALYGEQTCIIRASDIEVKRRQEVIQEFRVYIKDMQTLLDDYSIYEPDVWMNVFLSIQYIKAINSPSIKGIIKGVVWPEYERHVKAKGVLYIIPFEDYQHGFCEEYLKKIAGKDQIQILGAFIDPRGKKYIDTKDDEYCRIKKRIELNLGSDMKYTRWSQKKVYSLEKSKKFKTEDKAMFHKTINGVLVRNLVDTMISTEKMYDVEDYLYLLDKLCMFKSLNWQNLIGCLYIEVFNFKRELMALDLWADIEVMFEAWFMNLEAINRRLELLVQGLFYIIYKQDSFWRNVTEVEEKCKDALGKIEKNPISFSDREQEIISKEWAAQETKLQVLKGVEINHRQYYWIYAIMQRYVINGLTPSDCDELRERERDWNDVVGTIVSYYIAIENLENQNGVGRSRLDKKNNNMVEDNKENLSVGEICIGVLRRKQETNINSMQCKVTKEDLLSEIDSRLTKIRVKDDSGKIATAKLREIWDIFITLKVRENHTNFTKNHDNMKCLHKLGE